MPNAEEEKRVAAEAAAALVPRGATVGLGTGSTVELLLPVLAGLDLGLRCVATSPRTEGAALAVGLEVEPFLTLDRVDIAIDGADQVDPAGWIIKGGGGAHTREKIVALAAERFVVIVSSDKLVPKLTPPVPLELLEYGVRATLRALREASLRESPPSPDGGLIADYHATFEDPAELSVRLSTTPGVVDHGLFPPELVSEVVVGEGSTARTIKIQLLTAVSRVALRSLRSPAVYGNGAAGYLARTPSTKLTISSASFASSISSTFSAFISPECDRLKLPANTTSSATVTFACM